MPKDEVRSPSAPGDERAQLIAALRHDVRTPLQVLGLSLQALRLRARDAEDRELVFAAESALEEVAAITEDLVDSLRFGIRAEPPQEEGITLSNLLTEVERRFHRRAAQQNVDLRVLPTRIHCVADRRYLQRILDNLVSNALKHADATRIVVGARLRGYETLVLEVADDGRGIPEGEQTHVFAEWYRGRAAVSTKARGQGLGLWIVRTFVNAAGGRVLLRSKPGSGARFIVELPTYAERRAHPAARLCRATSGLDRKLIALLEDDQNVLREMRMSFESLGANVFATSDNLHFLANVTSMSPYPDLFVLDFSLGEGAIDRTIKVLKTRFGTSLRPVVVSTQSFSPNLHSFSHQVTLVEKPLTSEQMHFIASLAYKDT